MEFCRRLILIAFEPRRYDGMGRLKPARNGKPVPKAAVYLAIATPLVIFAIFGLIVGALTLLD
jgi:hypothetical protein